MSNPNSGHKKALYHHTIYENSTADIGLDIFPERWGGKSAIKIRITGRSDSGYATKMDDRHSISGGVVYIEGCSAVNRSTTH